MVTITSPISFIVPAYNCQDTVWESIESIMKTNFSSGDELIIVHDVSTDQTKKVLDEIVHKYPLIVRLENSINKGCPASRNIGITHSTNPLIFNLDADDVLEKNSVFPLKKFLIDNHADIAAYGQIHYFKTDTKHITHKWICKYGKITLADYLAGVVAPGGNQIYTKESWQRIGGYWEYGKGLHEFWGYIIKHLAHGSRFYVMPDSYYYHRYGRTSLYVRESSTINENSVMATKMLEIIKDQLDSESASRIFDNRTTNNWFNDFAIGTFKIRFRDGSIGTPGHVEYLEKKNWVNTKLTQIKSLLRLP